MCYFPGRDIVLDVGVLCNSEDITLTLTVTTDFFNGMIYPKGLSKNSTCMTEYIQQEASRDSDYHAREGAGVRQSRLECHVKVAVMSDRRLSPPHSLSPALTVQYQLISIQIIIPVSSHNAIMCGIQLPTIPQAGL